MSGIKVFAPASVANLAVGYDILGLALDKPGDEVVVKKGDKDGLQITKIINGKSLSKELHKNTAGFSALRLLQHLGEQNMPIQMELHKKMRLGTGLGSSAASAVAGVMGVNEFLGKPLTKAELLKFAVEGEQIADGSWHADNVAPSLFGGIILIRDNPSLDWKRIYIPEHLSIVIIHPFIKILTSESRALLKPTVSLQDMVAQTGNLASLVAALYTSDFNMIRRSLTDHIIEPQRKKLIPHFDKIKDIALNQDALGFSISGAGPSMFALCENSFIAENIMSGVKQFYVDKKLEVDVFISEINKRGAFKY